MDRSLGYSTPVKLKKGSISVNFKDVEEVITVEPARVAYSVFHLILFVVVSLISFAIHPLLGLVVAGFFIYALIKVNNKNISSYTISLSYEGIRGRDGTAVSRDQISRFEYFNPAFLLNFQPIAVVLERNYQKQIIAADVCSDDREIDRKHLLNQHAANQVMYNERTAMNKSDVLKNYCVEAVLQNGKRIVIADHLDGGLALQVLGVLRGFAQSKWVLEEELDTTSRIA
jgi:hypothetical protein